MIKYFKSNNIDIIIENTSSNYRKSYGNDLCIIEAENPDEAFQNPELQEITLEEAILMSNQLMPVLGATNG